MGRLKRVCESGENKLCFSVHDTNPEELKKGGKKEYQTNQVWPNLIRYFL